MKRYYGLLLILTLCLLVAGCRRGSSTKRAPVIVKNEIELLVPPNEDERMFKILPADRKYVMWLETIPEIESRLPAGQRKKEFGDISTRQEELEKDKDKEAEVSAGKAAAALKEGKYEFDFFVPKVFEFIKEKKSNPKEFNPVDFFTYMRRRDYVYERKFLDKLDMTVTIEKVRLIKLIDPPTLNFVYDIDPNEEDYIIAHRDASAGGGGGMMMGAPPMGAPPGGPLGGGGAAGPTKYVWFNKKDGFDQSLDAATLKTKLKHQDLRLLRTNFINYSRTYYLRPTADAAEAKFWTENIFFIYPNYDAVMQAMTYQRPGGPPAVLKVFEERMPQLLKTPHEPFVPEKFKKFLEDNAPPSVSDKLKSSETSFNPAADLRNSQHIIACRNEMEYLQDKDQKRELGHWAITTTGEIRYATTFEILPFAPGPPKKKEGGLIP